MNIEVDDLWVKCSTCKGEGQVVMVQGASSPIGPQSSFQQVICNDCQGQKGKLTSSGQAICKFINIARHAGLISSLLMALLLVGCSKDAEAKKLDPKAEVAALVEEGKKLSGNGAHQAAIEKFKKALELDGKNLDALRWLRSTYVATNDSANAAEYAGLLVTNGDKDSENHLILANNYIDKKSQAIATKQIKLFITAGGNSRTAEDLVARLLFEKRKAELNESELKMLERSMPEYKSTD